MVGSAGLRSWPPPSERRLPNNRFSAFRMNADQRAARTIMGAAFSRLASARAPRKRCNPSQCSSDRPLEPRSRSDKVLARSTSQPYRPSNHVPSGAPPTAPTHDTVEVNDPTAKAGGLSGALHHGVGTATTWTSRMACCTPNANILVRRGRSRDALSSLALKGRASGAQTSVSPQGRSVSQFTCAGEPSCHGGLARCEPTFPHLLGCSSTGPGRPHAAGVPFSLRLHRGPGPRVVRGNEISRPPQGWTARGVQNCAGCKGSFRRPKGDCEMGLAAFLMVDPKVLILIGAFLVAFAAFGVSNRIGR